MGDRRIGPPTVLSIFASKFAGWQASSFVRFRQKKTSSWFASTCCQTASGVSGAVGAKLHEILILVVLYLSSSEQDQPKKDVNGGTSLRWSMESVRVPELLGKSERWNQCVTHRIHGSGIFTNICNKDITMTSTIHCTIVHALEVHDQTRNGL